MKTMEVKKRDLSQSVDEVRNEGLVPAIVYGNKMENIAVSAPENVVRSLWKDIKEKQEFNLDIEGTVRKVVVQDMHVHPVSGQILHMDFLVVA